MRHVTAGFLVEFLGLDWRSGERWYHDTLVDADVAINAYMYDPRPHVCHGRLEMQRTQVAERRPQRT